MPVLITYDNGNRLEDVMRAVVQMTPTDTPFMSGIGKTRAFNTIHQWPEVTLTTRQDNAVAENNTFSTATSRIPARRTNLTQIFEDVFGVSSTEAWVKSAGIDDQLAFQKQTSLMQIGTDVEHALLRGSIASGASGTARRLAGVLNYVTTNATSVASSTRLTESFFGGISENAYAQGGRPDEVYVGYRLKRIIASFTAGSTKTVAQADKRLTNVVDVYEDDLGQKKVFLSRDILSGTNGNSNALAMLDIKKFRMAIGEEVHELPMDQVAQDRNGTTGVHRGELTLEVLAERHSAVVFGLSEKFN
jgi:hypothetical protein